MGEIITFYSYKGGVGRTMALANIAVLLSQWTYKVLIVDWDLEAPGLEFYFKDYLEDLDKVSQTEGVIDLLCQAFETSDSQANRKWQNLLHTISVPGSITPLHFLNAGKKDDHYFGKVRGLDISAFYSERNGGLFLESLREEWKQEYDFILLDSRAGITDIGGICTVQLPDLLVLLFTATEQSLRGTIEVAQKVNDSRQNLPVDRYTLLSLPVPSRFDAGEEFEISQKWLKRFAEELTPIYDYWLPTAIERLNFVEITKIPYVAYFSFGEKLPVIDQGTNDPQGLGYTYQTLSALIARKLEDTEELVNNRSEFVRVASRQQTSMKKIHQGLLELNWRLDKMQQQANQNVPEEFTYLVSKIVLGIQNGKTEIENLSNSWQQYSTGVDQQHINTLVQKTDGILTTLKQMLELARNSFTIPEGDMTEFLDLFDEFMNELREGLQELVSEQRGMIFGDGFKLKVEKVCTLAKEKLAKETPPLLPDSKELERQCKRKDGWLDVLLPHLNQLRAYLTRYLAENLDAYLKGTVDEVLAKALKRMFPASLNNLVTLDSNPDRDPRNIIQELQQSLDKNKQPNLYAAFEYLIRFNFSYHGLFHYRVRSVMTWLDSFETDTIFQLTAGATRDNIPQKSKEIARGLHYFYLNTLYLVSKKLGEDMQADPASAIFAMVEEIQDRLAQTKGIDKEWRGFLYPLRGRVWPEKFQVLAEKETFCQEWRTLIDDTLKPTQQMQSDFRSVQ
jgi:cellulose biosynthesis protein BcsQ